MKSNVFSTPFKIIVPTVLFTFSISLNSLLGQDVALQAAGKTFEECAEYSAAMMGEKYSCGTGPRHYMMVCGHYDLPFRKRACGGPAAPKPAPAPAPKPAPPPVIPPEPFPPAPTPAPPPPPPPPVVPPVTPNAPVSEPIGYMALLASALVFGIYKRFKPKG